jgi:hypothetical protein
MVYQYKLNDIYYFTFYEIMTSLRFWCPAKKKKIYQHICPVSLMAKSLTYAHPLACGGEGGGLDGLNLRHTRTITAQDRRPCFSLKT